MYNYVTGFVKKDRRWVEKHVLESMMQDLLVDYREVRITFFDTVANAEVNWSPQEDSSNYHRTFGGTMGEFLSFVNHNQMRLETTNDLFNLEDLVSVNCREVLQVGFRVARGNRYMHPDSKGNETGVDLHLTRDGTNFSRFHGNSLFTVNGIIHPAVINDYGIYLREGHHTVKREGMQDISCINFEPVGGFVAKPFAKSWFYRANGRPQLLCNKTTFRYPEGTDDKLFGVVVDGYLHLLDGAITVRGESSLEINWDKIPLRSRFIAEDFCIRGEGSAREVKPRYQEKDLLTDAWLEDILFSPFTFLMIMNRTDISTYRAPLIPKKIPGLFYKEGKIQGLLKTQHGKIYSGKVDTDVCSYAELKLKHEVVSLPVTNEYPPLIETGYAEPERVLTKQGHMHLGLQTPTVMEVRYMVED